MTREKGPSHEQTQKTVSEIRREKLVHSIERMREELTPSELSQIRAILLIGSTARGSAKENSDVDLYLAPDKEKFDHNIFKKVFAIIDEELPDVQKQYGVRPLIAMGRGASFITKRSAKHREEAPLWDYLYVRSADDRSQIEEVLQGSLARNEELAKRRPSSNNEAGEDTGTPARG